MEDASLYAWNNGSLLVAASGNDGKRGVTYPAAYETVIAVGAIDKNDQRCGFSNWGPKLRISDWHNITFNPPFTLIANETYTIRTGSYPQVHHTRELPTANGWINCTKFTDVNGM